MRASAYLRSKFAPAAGEPLGLTKPRRKTLLNWPSRGLPRSVERATGRPRICFANPHRLQAPSGAFACSLQTLRVCFTLAPWRVRVPALIEKSTAPERCRAFTFSGAGNGTRTRECQLGKLMPYHLAMPACVLASITRLSCSIQGCRCLF